MTLNTVKRGAIPTESLVVSSESCRRGHSSFLSILHPVPLSSIHKIWGKWGILLRSQPTFFDLSKQPPK